MVQCYLNTVNGIFLKTQKSNKQRKYTLINNAKGCQEGKKKKEKEGKGKITILQHMYKLTIYTITNNE